MLMSAEYVCTSSVSCEADKKDVRNRWKECILLHSWTCCQYRFRHMQIAGNFEGLTTRLCNL